MGIVGNTNAKGTSYIRRCKFNNIFDSGTSPQTWENAGKIIDINYEDCTAEKCGLTGYEISITSKSGTFTNSIEAVNLYRCKALDSGTGFSGIRYGSTGNGFAFLVNDTSPNSKLINCGVYDSEAIGCVGGIAAFHTGGNVSAKNNFAAKCKTGIIDGAARGSFVAESNIIMANNLGVKSVGRGAIDKNSMIGNLRDFDGCSIGSNRCLGRSLATAV